MSVSARLFGGRGRRGAAVPGAFHGRQEHARPAAGGPRSGLGRRLGVCLPRRGANAASLVPPGRRNRPDLFRVESMVFKGCQRGGSGRKTVQDDEREGFEPFLTFMDRPDPPARLGFMDKETESPYLQEVPYFYVGRCFFEKLALKAKNLLKKHEIHIF